MKIVTLNKKGSLFDYVESIPYIFVMVVVAIVTILMFIKVNDSGAFSGSTESQNIADNFEAVGLRTIDLVPIMAFIGLFVGSLILAFALPTNPALFWVNILFLTILIILSVGISNAYEIISDNTGLQEATNLMPITGFFMGKLPIFTMVYGIVLTIVMLGLKAQTPEDAGAFGV